MIKINTLKQNKYQKLFFLGLELFVIKKKDIDPRLKRSLTR